MGARISSVTYLFVNSYEKRLEDKAMLKGENIIVFSSADWKIGPTSPQHISTNFAQDNKVLFVETFGSRHPVFGRDDIIRIKHRIRNWFKGIKEHGTIKRQLYIYSPITLLLNARPFLLINRFIFLNILRRLIKKLNMENPILYFYLPPPPGILGRLKEKAVVYHCVDEWLTFPGGKNKILMDAEKKLIEEADLVLAANELLYQSKKPFARRIHKIYHGVEFEHFTKEFPANAPLPEDIRDVPRPIIAIIGNFADWMDLDLLKLIAQRHKEWSVVSIGPVDENVDINSLRNLSNVYFLGQRNYSELPNYYRVIDVFIIPFLLTEHIKTCAPTRLYEHLSSGKPIVATDFPAAREIGGGLISIATAREDFVRKIEEALKEKDASLAERRKTVAKENTWKSRVKEISQIIEEILAKKNANS